jgi:hypothetical protein
MHTRTHVHAHTHNEYMHFYTCMCVYTNSLGPACFMVKSSLLPMSIYILYVHIYTRKRFMLSRLRVRGFERPRILRAHKWTHGTQNTCFVVVCTYVNVYAYKHSINAYTHTYLYYIQHAYMQSMGQHGSWSHYSGCGSCFHTSLFPAR